MEMRRTFTFALVALASIAALYATDTWEGGTLFHTNALVDASDECIATTRSVQMEYLDSNGEGIEESSATAYYTLKNHGSRIERQISGDRDVFALLDTIYDGYVMTPFNDSIYAYDHDRLEDQDVDGVLCEVYRFEVAMDLNTLHAGRAAGELLGWDEEQDEEDGDIVMTLYVDPSNGLVVRQDMHIVLSGNSYVDQSACFELQEIDGTTVMVPIRVVTSGMLQKASSAPEVLDAVYFSALETFSDYQMANGWHD